MKELLENPWRYKHLESRKATQQLYLHTNPMPRAHWELDRDSLFEREEVQKVFYFFLILKSITVYISYPGEVIHSQ